MINNSKEENENYKDLEEKFKTLNNKFLQCFDNEYQKYIEDSDNIEDKKTIKEDYNNNNKKQCNKTFDNLITLNNEITNDETNLMKIDYEFNTSKKKDFKDLKNIEFILKASNENSINLQNIKKINSNNKNNNIFPQFLQKNTFERIEVKEDTIKLNSSMPCNYKYITDSDQANNNQIFENINTNKYDLFYNHDKNGIQKMVFRNNINFCLFRKKGRISNYLKKKGLKGKHNNKRVDNAIRKIINSCSKNFDSFIRDICEKYYVNNLHKLNIKKDIGNSFKDYSKFFNKYIKDIYKNFKPRRLKIEAIKEGYEKEMANLKNAISKEKKIKDEEEKKDDKNAKKKILGMLINETTFKNVLKCYLFDKNKIISENGEIIPVEGFKTYKDSLNEYDDELKKKYKEKILDIINGKAKQKRKRDSKTYNKVRFNVISQP